MGKIFYAQCSVGVVKYIVNFHDGVTTHKDGSPFFNVRFFRNKKRMLKFMKELKENGYKERA